MKNIFVTFICLLVFISCESNNIQSVQVGMTQEEVLSMMGEPDEKQVIGTGPELDAEEKVQIEVWYYGDDQNIAFSNQKVSSVDLNAKQTTENLLKRRKEMKEEESSK